ncbi:hypothetical protein MAPG_11708 [Magnaporthiopsis poae ATCC 64411]|uniref:Copper transport protein n=1 Tax=Magnaporthiopsis poae (strain ATCC 64411 / 73-15) TaxID=644358 RepID=A0A0C4EFZ6_MAGP6|nr:hypothetical protein MAPG_11708 [Magnaporthiopsis poae ATCC 64411]
MDGMDMPGMATIATPTGTQTAAPTIVIHNGDGGTTMGMSAMSMTFFHSASTPLFWDWWKPSGAQQYAATCVFLIVLAAVTRILFAVRPLIHARCRGSSGTRHYCLPLNQDKQTMTHHNATTEELLPSDDKTGGLNEKDPETVAPKAATGIASRWWNSATVGERLLRASCEAVLVCLGYFLMLAVMTMNIGYFVSVLSDPASQFLQGLCRRDGPCPGAVKLTRTTARLWLYGPLAAAQYYLIGLGYLPYDPLCAESCLRSLMSYTLSCTPSMDMAGGSGGGHSMSHDAAGMLRRRRPVPHLAGVVLGASDRELNAASIVNTAVYLMQWNVLGSVVDESKTESKYSLVVILAAIATPVLLTCLGHLPFGAAVMDKVWPYAVYLSIIGKH